MPILSPSFRYSVLWRDVLLGTLAAGVACLLFYPMSCCEALAQDAIQRDAIRRIERDYNAGQAGLRLTALTLRSRKNVSLTSNLIRLGDVVEPVDPDLPGWGQLARLGIGLVPVDGTEMVIERHRLEPFIHSGHKNSVLIRWIGPQKIKVRSQSGRGKVQSAVIHGEVPRDPTAGFGSASEVSQASVASNVGRLPGGRSGRVRPRMSIKTIDPHHLLKINRWIIAASSASQESNLDRYDFRVVDVEKIRPTNRGLDVAILGAAFLQVIDHKTNRRTCLPGGALDVDDYGDLVVKGEHSSMPLYPAVNVPKEAHDLRIKSDGTIEVQLGENLAWVVAGKMAVSNYVRQADRLSTDGRVTLAGAIELDSPLLPAEESGAWQVLQGFLESPQHEAYQEFESISGIEEVTCLHKLREGLCKFRLEGRGLDGPIDLIVSMQLTAKSVVAAPKKSFPRGHRLALQDVHLIPIEAGEIDEKHFDSLQQLVGMEVSKSLRLNRPILRSDVRQPTLVRRGDLLDLRVVGAGIVITTAAKALEDGPLNGLVEVETLRPRKRKIARVVASGVVEILSRPPQLENSLE